MEKLEYNLVREFIIDLGEFLEDKKAEDFNWGFIEDKFYLLKENDIFRLTKNMKCIKNFRR